jgi:hypothetical protein
LRENRKNTPPLAKLRKKIAVKQRKKSKYAERNVEETRGEHNRERSFEIKNHLLKLADFGQTLGGCQGMLKRFERQPGKT